MHTALEAAVEEAQGDQEGTSSGRQQCWRRGRETRVRSGNCFYALDYLHECQGCSASGAGASFALFTGKVGVVMEKGGAASSIHFT